MCKHVFMSVLLLGLAVGTAQAIQAPIDVPNGNFEDYLSVGSDPGNWSGESGGIGSIVEEFGTNDEVWTNPSSFGSGWQSNGPQATGGKFGLQCPHASNHHQRLGTADAIDNLLVGSFSGHLIGFMNLTEGDGEGNSAGQVQSAVVGTLEAGSYRLTVAVGARPSGSWNDTWYQISLVADPVAGPNDPGSSGGTVLGTPASVTLVPSTAVIGSNQQDLVYTLDVGPNDPYLGAPIAVRIDLANAGTQNGVETTLSTFTQANYDNVRLCHERAANVVFVSFHGADDVPSDTAAGVGFTEAPDKGYTDLLKANGYNVSRYITTSTPDANVLNVADLVIIGRSVASGGYQNDGATAWNNIATPMIIMGGYTLRNSRMGYTTGGTMVDTTGDVTLSVNDPSHPIFAGVALDANSTMINFYAEGAVVLPTDGTTLSRGISINNDPVNTDGTVLAAIAGPADPNDPNAIPANGPVGGLVIGEWQAGSSMTHSGGAGTDILAGHRLVFLSGSREPSGVTGGDAAGLYDLYADGEKMFLNAVGYMLPCYPCAPTTTDLLAQYLFDDGTARDTSGNGLDGVLNGTAKIVDVAGGSVLELDGVDNDANSAFVNIPDPCALLDSSVNGSATLAAWVLMDVSKNHNTIFSQGEWRDGLSLAVKGDTNPTDQLWTGRDQSSPISDDVYRSDVGVPVGTWNHVALTLNYNSDTDTTNVAFYLNGVATGFAQGGGSPITGKVIAPVAGGSRIGMEDRDGDATVDINGNGSGRWVWDGLIDDVHIYGAALSGSEICYLASQAPGDLLAAEIPNLLENGSFEEPGEAQVGFDNVPAWDTDSAAANSGARMDGATDGDFVAYLGAGDPSIRQTTGLTLQAGDALSLTADASASGAALLQMTLLVDLLGQLVPVVNETIALTDTMTEVGVELLDSSAFIGLPVSVELANVGDAGSEVILDNVHLSLIE